MSVHWISKEKLQDRPHYGMFLNLGSATSAELAASKGFDWLLVDNEHGLGDFSAMVSQFQAMSGWPVSPLVRVQWNDTPLIKRVLDAGAAGVMVPYINSPQEAEAVAAAMRYPPLGVRGAAGTTRATALGSNTLDYHDQANARVLTIVQIETAEAVAAADEIASVDGIDVLFVGPLDLSFNLGQPHDYETAVFRQAMSTVVEACAKHRRTAGILATQATAARARDDGFRFIGIGSDGHGLNAGVSAIAKVAQQLRTQR